MDLSAVELEAALAQAAAGGDVEAALFLATFLTWLEGPKHLATLAENPD